VVVARRVEWLEEVKSEWPSRHPGLVLRAEPCDLSDPDAVNDLSGRLLEEFGVVDVLVNNAGAGLYGLYEESDWERVHALIRLNIIALALLTRRLTPVMVARGRGGVLNMNSGAGVATMPGWRLTSAPGTSSLASPRRCAPSSRGQASSSSRPCQVRWRASSTRRRTSARLACWTGSLQDLGHTVRPGGDLGL
jgi:NAD(P)-dependent dehydrogenase (short-subunit alcohol dehydrogenase family)